MDEKKEFIIVCDIPPEELTRSIELLNEWSSYDACLKYAPTVEEREKWRRDWVSTKIAFDAEIDRLRKKFMSEEDHKRIDQSDIRGTTSIIDVMDNKLRIVVTL